MSTPKFSADMLEIALARLYAGETAAGISRDMHPENPESFRVTLVRRAAADRAVLTEEGRVTLAQRANAYIAEGLETLSAITRLYRDPEYLATLTPAEIVEGANVIGRRMVAVVDRMPRPGAAAADAGPDTLAPGGAR